MDFKNMGRLRSKDRIPSSERNPKPEIRAGAIEMNIDHVGSIPKAIEYRNSEFGCRRSFDAITMPSPGRNKIVPKLLPDVRHMHIQQIGKCAVVLVEQVLVKRRARHDLAPVRR